MYRSTSSVLLLQDVLVSVLPALTICFPVRQNSEAAFQTRVLNTILCSVLQDLAITVLCYFEETGYTKGLVLVLMIITALILFSRPSYSLSVCVGLVAELFVANTFGIKEVVRDVCSSQNCSLQSLVI